MRSTVEDRLRVLLPPPSVADLEAIVAGAPLPSPPPRSVDVRFYDDHPMWQCW
jgi:hypothetical protein